jgi:hypothetical protein
MIKATFEISEALLRFQLLSRLCDKQLYIEWAQEQVRGCRACGPVF